MGKIINLLKIWGFFLTKVTNKLIYPGVDIGSVMTNSKGIATFKNKLTEFGYITILVHSSEHIYAIGGGDNTASCGIYVYKSFF